MFTPPGSDWTVEILNHIFGPGWQTFYLNGASSANVLDTVMGEFGKVMFMAMSVFYIYTASIGSYATAHEGVALGKQYHWAYSPLRLVTGFGMLAPLGPGGLSALSGLVLYFVSMGIGIADDMWGTGLTWMQQHNGGITTISSEDPEDLTPGMLKIAVAEYVLLTQSPSTIADPPTWVQVQDYPTCPEDTSLSNPPACVIDPTADNKWVLTFPTHQQGSPGTSGSSGESNSALGSVVITCPSKEIASFATPGDLPAATAGNTAPANAQPVVTPNPGADAFCQVRKNAVINIWNAVQQVAYGMVKPDAPNVAPPTPPPAITTSAVAMAAMTAPAAKPVAPGQATAPQELDQSLFATQAINYQTTIGAGVAAYSKSFNQELTSDENEFTTVATNQGWSSAGAWYLQIARVNNDVQESIGKKPDVTLPALTSQTINQELQPYLEQVDTAYSEYSTNAPPGALNYHQPGVISYTDSDQEQNGGSGVGRWIENKINHIIRDPLASFYKTLIGNISSGQDPIATIQTTGHAMLDLAAASELLTLSRTATTLVGSSTLHGLAKALAVPGVLMAYVIPLTPFVLWLLAVISWLILVLECWVAAPVWAMAHGMPEGEGFVGQQARQGYVLFFSVLIKPPLLVLGYFLSLLMVSAIMPFVALMFGVVFQGNTGGEGALSAILDFIGYSFAFVAISFFVIRKCYSLITWVPDNILRWIGGRGTSLGVTSGDVASGVGGAVKGAAALAGGGAFVAKGVAGAIVGKAQAKEDRMKGLLGELKGTPGGGDFIQRRGQDEILKDIVDSGGKDLLTQQGKEAAGEARQSGGNETPSQREETPPDSGNERGEGDGLSAVEDYAQYDSPAYKRDETHKDDGVNVAPSTDNPGVEPEFE